MKVNFGEPYEYTTRELLTKEGIDRWLNDPNRYKNIHISETLIQVSDTQMHCRKCNTRFMFKEELCYCWEKL